MTEWVPLFQQHSTCTAYIHISNLHQNFSKCQKEITIGDCIDIVKSFLGKNSWPECCCSCTFELLLLLLLFSRLVMSSSLWPHGPYLMAQLFVTPWTIPHGPQGPLCLFPALSPIVCSNSSESAMPSNNFILCHCLLLLPQSFPESGPFPMSCFSLFSHLNHYMNSIIYVWACAKLLQLCPTFCNSVDHSPPGSSVHGILLGGMLEWVAISFSFNYI